MQTAESVTTFRLLTQGAETDPVVGGAHTSARPAEMPIVARGSDLQRWAKAHATKPIGAQTKRGDLSKPAT